MNFYLQHGQTAGPFRTEAVEARENWYPPQKRSGNITPCRFMVKYAGRWHRVYSDHSPGLTFPHFIRSQGERIVVQGVAP